MLATPADRPVRRPDFQRAAFAFAQSRILNTSPDAYLNPKVDEVAIAFLQRAAATPGSTTGAGWAAELSRATFRNFLADLEPISGGARLIGLAVPATLGNAELANYPVRVSGRKVPAWVGENGEIPVVSGELDNIVLGPRKTMAHMVAWSRELARRSDAARIFAQLLREDVAAGIDFAFFSATEGSAAAEEGLLFGLTATTPTGGPGEAGIKSDLGRLAETVSTGGSGGVLFVMNPAQLARLRIEAPTVAASADIAPSGQVPAGRVIAIDPQSILCAVDETPDIGLSKNAVVHMSDVPLPIGDSGFADPVRSMWQTASQALRVLHEMAFEKRRAGAVAFSDGVNWW